MLHFLANSRISLACSAEATSLFGTIVVRDQDDLLPHDGSQPRALELLEGQRPGDVVHHDVVDLRLHDLAGMGVRAGLDATLSSLKWSWDPCLFM